MGGRGGPRFFAEQLERPRASLRDRTAVVRAEWGVRPKATPSRLLRRGTWGQVRVWPGRQVLLRHPHSALSAPNGAPQRTWRRRQREKQGPYQTWTKIEAAEPKRTAELVTGGRFAMIQSTAKRHPSDESPAP